MPRAELPGADDGRLQSSFLRAGEKINLIAVEEVAREEVSSYGIVGIEAGEGPLWPMTSMVEKPTKEEAPSNLIIMGRYILQPEIFDILSSQERGAGNEIQITDAMKTLMQTQRFFAYKFSGRSYRLRLQARLSPRQCGLRARSQGDRPAFRPGGAQAYDAISLLNAGLQGQIFCLWRSASSKP